MTHNPPAPNWGLHILRAVLGAVFGLAVTAPFLAYAGPALALGGSGAIALSGVAIIYAMMGLTVGLGTLMPRGGAKVLNVGGPDDLVDQRAVLLGSAAGSLVIGGALMLLALAGPAGVIPAGLALSALAFSMVLTALIGVLQWRQYDELMRALSSEGGAIAFMLSLAVLGGWAALAHLGRAVPLEPLWVLALTALFLLVGSFIAAGRRGLLIKDPD